MSQPDYDMLKLQHQLCFPLYAAARKVVQKYHPHLEAIGLTYTQYITMMVMWEHKQISVKALGQQLYLDSGTVTPVLKSLESKGYVRRKRSLADERSVLVQLTEHGEALRERAVEIPAKLAGCLDLDAQDAAQLYTLLYRLLDAEQ